jgi:hypothetical protein
MCVPELAVCRDMGHLDPLGASDGAVPEPSI